MLTKIFFFFLFFLLICWTRSDQWYSKSQCTQKEFASNMDVHCHSSELILIGWSHYGTKKAPLQNQTSTQQCQPSENDCIMDYTHKIAELCNGISKCEVILTQQFIHKCSDEATYLFVSYQCIQSSNTIDICSKRSFTSANGLNLISPMFPNEYPNNVNCTCSIEAKKKSTVMIDVENLSFNLQDNDKFLFLSGSYPFGASLLTSRNQLNLQFKTDETLSQSGFWIRLYGYPQCHSDEIPLGSKCLKIFPKKQNWITAQATCLSLDSHLLRLSDIIAEKKLAYYLSLNPIHSSTFWISNEKISERSWWPWRASLGKEKCILRTPDGWRKSACQDEQTFICERDLAQQAVPLAIRCGNLQATTQAIPTVVTERSTTQLSSSAVASKKRAKTESFDTTLLAAILCGVAIAVFAINMMICFLYKRQVQVPLKSKSNPNDSNSSITQEELQRSLMHHLYHEQTNTISSTSTSSSSKRSKSNDTTTSNLFQVSSNPSSLCLRNPHIKTEPLDYHVYETIPAENLTYTLCTSHRPFPSTTPVIMPICCHHYSPQCSAGGTWRLPQVPIHTRSESIV